MYNERYVEGVLACMQNKQSPAGDGSLQSIDFYSVVATVCVPKSSKQVTNLRLVYGHHLDSLAIIVVLVSIVSRVEMEWVFLRLNEGK